MDIVERKRGWFSFKQGLLCLAGGFVTRTAGGYVAWVCVCVGGGGCRCVVVCVCVVVLWCGVCVCVVGWCVCVCVCVCVSQRVRTGKSQANMYLLFIAVSLADLSTIAAEVVMDMKIS